MSAEIDGTSKGLLGGFTALTLGSGLATLGYGIFLLYQNFGFTYNYGDFNLFIASIVLIVVGSLLIITLLLGVLGALKDISNLRLATLVLLFILFVVLAVVGAYGMVLYKTGRLNKSISDEIKDLNINYNNSTAEAQAKANALNNKLFCCGYFNEFDPLADYKGAPRSCCISEDCEYKPDNKHYHERSCAIVYSETKTKTVFCVAVLTLIVAGVILLALVLYAGLSQRAREGYAVVSRGPLK
ncbi:hypothetical protein I4U23_030019 [Adineta vaga]|nr:hypothetical protein I4U23_030019 [Adineta vaga]